MGKQEIKQKETQVSTNGGIGKQLEQTFTVDDNCLPSPGELQAYKNIDPRIVDYLIDASVKEQTHRHAMDKQKLQIIKKTEGRIGRMNWWGMFFAFLCILVFSTVTGYALYLDKPWFAGIMGGAVLISIVSIFVKGNSRFPQALRYRLVLQRRQCALSGFVVQLFQPFLQFGVQLYPSVQLCRGAAGCGVREIGLCQVTHVDCFHSALQVKN